MRGLTIYLTSTQTTILVVSMSVLGAAIIAVLIFLFIRYIYTPRRYKRQIRDLDSKTSYYSGLLRGQVSQYLNRLEQVSRSNLLFVELYEEYSTSYRHIMDSDEKFALENVNQLRELLSNKQYKSLKVSLQNAQGAVSIYENAVNSLNDKLIECSRPDDECRARLVSLKEMYRYVEQSYKDVSSELTLVSSSFEQVFHKLDSLLSDTEDHLSRAEYEEANANLPTIEKVLSSLERAIKELPNLCILVEDIIPNAIKSVTSRYNELIGKDIPLYHLGFKNYSTQWNTSISNIKKKLKDLDLSGVSKELGRIQSEIDEMNIKLGEEGADKDVFNSSSYDVYHKVSALDDEFIKVSSRLPKYEEGYILNEEELNKFDELKVDINEVTSAKRNLETILHETTPQPYSYLATVLTEVNMLYDSTSKKLHDFTSYLDSLKSSSEEAYKLIFDYVYKLKELEASMRSLAISDIFDLYKERINDCYALINEIDALLTAAPIDVDKVKEESTALKEIADSTIREVSGIISEAHLAESALVYLAQDRAKQNDINSQVLLLEQEFFKGHFKNVYDTATTIYQARHIDS
ncbi:MAG: septation ring formation regulator EzrA [Coprobacillus sp.]|nr:septation ring formation regulator EzrA [Coprobacillus sp.]